MKRLSCTTPHWPRTQFAAAIYSTIRPQPLKLGALVQASARRIKVAIASACPWQNEFARTYVRLRGTTAYDEPDVA